MSLQRIILIFKYSESIIIQTGKITEICKRTMKVNKTKKRDDAWNFVCNCYDHHPGDTNEEKTEIKMSEYRSECRMGNWLLFTHHYPARCFGMNMPKSRDIQAKIHSKCSSHFFHLTKLGCYVNIHKCVTKRNKNVIILQRCITGVDK